MSVKTLVFGGGAIHDWKGIQPYLEAALKEDGGFEIDLAQEDLSALEAENLEGYDALVFHYTVGEITAAQREGLSKWLASGKGFVPIHSAADSFRGDPDYRNIVGGHFVTHPRYRQYQVSLNDTEHPVMKDVDNEFFVTDEQYILDYDPRVQVLASALHKGESHPVVWTKNHGEGRVCYIALGHDTAACEHPMFAKLVVNGTRWASGK